MATTERSGFSPAAEKNLHFALDDVITELRERLLQKLAILAEPGEPLVEASPLRASALTEALLSELDRHVIDAVAARLLESRDQMAHLRRNALMRLLVEADAPAGIPDEVCAAPVVVFEGDDEMLTSEQAAKLLNVSRPHLNKLLDKGLIPGVQRFEGEHRSISKEAVSRYKAEMKQRQAHAADKVLQLTEEMGLYDDELKGIGDVPSPDKR